MGSKWALLMWCRYAAKSMYVGTDEALPTFEVGKALLSYDFYEC